MQYFYYNLLFYSTLYKLYYIEYIFFLNLSSENKKSNKLIVFKLSLKQRDIIRVV